MAQGIQFVCGNCDKKIEAWSDGNPFFIDEEGEKLYAYHPHNDLLERCIANDVPHLCLECGEEFEIDSRTPVAFCSKCASSNIAETYELAGHQCPDCKKGVFSLDLNFLRIS